MSLLMRWMKLMMMLTMLHGSLNNMTVVLERYSFLYQHDLRCSIEDETDKTEIKLYVCVCAGLLLRLWLIYDPGCVLYMGSMMHFL